MPIGLLKVFYTFRTAAVLSDIWGKFSKDSLTQRFVADLHMLERDLTGGKRGKKRLSKIK